MYTHSLVAEEGRLARDEYQMASLSCCLSVKRTPRRRANKHSRADFFLRLMRNSFILVHLRNSRRNTPASDILLLSHSNSPEVPVIPKNKFVGEFVSVYASSIIFLPIFQIKVIVCNKLLTIELCVLQCFVCGVLYSLLHVLVLRLCRIPVMS